MITLTDLPDIIMQLPLSDTDKLEILVGGHNKIVSASPIYSFLSGRKTININELKLKKKETI